MQFVNSIERIRIPAILFLCLLITGCHKDSKDTVKATLHYTAGLSGIKMCSGNASSMLRGDTVDPQGFWHSVYPVINRSIVDSSLVLTAVNDTVIAFAGGQLYFDKIDSVAQVIVFFTYVRRPATVCITVIKPLTWIMTAIQWACLATSGMYKKGNAGRMPGIANL